MIKVKFLSVLEYLFCFLLILNCRTIYVHMIHSSIGEIVNLLLFFVLFFLILFQSKGNLKKKTLFSTFLIILYFALFYFVNVSISKVSYIKNFIILLPLLIIYFSLMDFNQIKSLFKRYSKVVMILALISLFFYLFGSYLNLFRQNVSAIIQWGGYKRVYGYSYLHFNVQSTFFLGKHILRNTGIFVEGPMYSLQLIIAYAFILFDSKKLIDKKSIILGLSLLSTLSITGMIIFIILSFYKYVKVNKTQLKIILLPVILIGSIFLSMILVQDKQESNSYRIRSDDVRVAMHSFINRPIFGDGYMNNDIAISNMSGFRLYNTGLSSTFLIVLIHGGVYLSMIYFLPIIILLMKSKKRKNNFYFSIAVLQLLLYFTSAFQYTTLMMFFIAFNIHYMFDKESDMEVEKCNMII